MVSRQLGEQRVSALTVESRRGERRAERAWLIAERERKHEYRHDHRQKGGAVDPQVQHAALAYRHERVLCACRRLAAVCRRIDLSKLDAGALELRPEQVDLGELTRSVNGEFEPVLAQHDAHLELRLATRAIELVCDPVRVAQIMRILLDNALIHNPAGTRIVVTAIRDEARVRPTVRDNGAGIPEHALEIPG
jgi:signal transduction histidine kinase